VTGAVHELRRRRPIRGVALLEAVAAAAILAVLVGSVAYAARIALSVMTESMKETQLLFRVRRALDQVEEELSRCTRISVVAMTEDGWTLAGLENWFAQQALQHEGQPLGEEADEVRSQLREGRRALEEAIPAFPRAENHLGRAIEEFDEIVDASLLGAGAAARLEDALDAVQASVRMRSLALLNGGGTGYLDAWRELEATIASGDALVPAEPLTAADHVLFRKAELGAGGREFRPPLDEPPAALYLRPMQGDGGFELVHHDGTDPVVLVSHLTGATFEQQGASFRIVVRFLEDDAGVVRERTEVRTIVLRTP